MTIEERVEFLHQSIESHDRQLGEITDHIRTHDRQLGDLTTKFDGLTGMLAKLLETMQVLADTTLDMSAGWTPSKKGAEYDATRTRPPE